MPDRDFRNFLQCNNSKNCRRVFNYNKLRLLVSLSQFMTSTNCHQLPRPENRSLSGVRRVNSPVLTTRTSQQPITSTSVVAPVLCNTKLFNVDGCAITTVWWLCHYNCLMIVPLQLFDGCVITTDWWLCHYSSLMVVPLQPFDGCAITTVWWLCHYNCLMVVPLQLFDGCAITTVWWLCHYNRLMIVPLQ